MFKDIPVMGPNMILHLILPRYLASLFSAWSSIHEYLMAANSGSFDRSETVRVVLFFCVSPHMPATQ